MQPKCMNSLLIKSTAIFWILGSLQNWLGFLKCVICFDFSHSKSAFTSNQYLTVYFFFFFTLQYCIGFAIKLVFFYLKKALQIV